MSDCLDDDTLALFADDKLPAERHAAASEHLERCPSCRDLLAHVLPETRKVDGPALDPDDEIAAASTIGRYRIEGVLGRGGMGLVLLARDPELDRPVAIKVLRHERRDDEARLLREARSMAKLTHPNVLTIFDVGVSNGRVYLAMEYVAGTTLRGWLAKEKRSPEAIVEIYSKAGRGLAAAHRAGIVHRDFKPDNVLVGDDGRVRVADFGLARSSGRAPMPHEDAPPSSAGDGLTRTGSVMGTPAYMATEQHEGGKATPRTDQFALAVALWEALYGARPFSGKTVNEIRANVMAGNVVAPAGGNVPRRVERALRRALSPDPAKRFEDVDRFLSALEPPRRRIALAAAGAIAVAVIGVLAYRSLHPAPPPADGPKPCAGVEHELEDTWNPSERAKLRAALVRADVTPAAAASRDETADRVLANFDGYAASWLAEAKSACEATNVSHTLSNDAYAARFRCLVERKDEMRALVTALQRGDAAMLDRSVVASATLSPVASCASAVSVGPRGVDPPAPAIAADVERIRTKLRDARALQGVGHDYDAQQMAEEAVKEARALEYRPLIAEALLAHGELENAADSKSVLLEAVWMAEASHHDVVAAKAWVALLRDASVERDFANLEEWSARASAAIERLVGEAPVKASLHSALAETRFEVGRPAEAKKLATDALRTRASRVGEETLEDASDLELRALAEAAIDEREAAAADLAAELAIVQRILGADFDGTANIHLQLGRLEGEAGTWDAALASLARADALANANLARVRGRADRVAASDASTLAAVIHAEAPSFGVIALRARIALARAQVLEARGDLAGAEAEFRTAIAIGDGTFGAKNRTSIPARVGVSELLRRRGKSGVDDAMVAYDSAKVALATSDPDRVAAIAALAAARGGAAGRALLAEIPTGVTLPARLAARLAIARAELDHAPLTDADPFLARAGRLADPERERAAKLRPR